MADVLDTLRDLRKQATEATPKDVVMVVLVTRAIDEAMPEITRLRAALAEAHRQRASAMELVNKLGRVLVG